MNLTKAKQVRDRGEWRSGKTDWNASQHRLARYWHRNLDRLAALIRQERPATLWGQESLVTPYLIGQKFGDGMQLVRLWPINQRPSFWLAMVDSRVGLDHGDELPFIDVVDEIYEAIDEEFGDGNWVCEDCGEESRDGSEHCHCYDERGFPSGGSLDGGSSWAYAYWPTPGVKFIESFC